MVPSRYSGQMSLKKIDSLINQNQWWTIHGVVMDVVAGIEYIADPILVEHRQETSDFLRR